MDLLFFLRCAETAIAIMVMTMSFGILRHHAKLRIVATLIILIASCIVLTAVYQFISLEMAKKIYVPMIIFIFGGLVLFNSADKFWVTYFNFLTQFMIYFGISMASGTVTRIFFNSEVGIYLLFRAVAFALVIFLEVKYIRKLFRYIVCIADSQWFLISLLVSVFTGLIVMLCVYPTMYFDRDLYGQIEIVLAYLLYFIVLGFIYAALRNTVQKYELLQSETEMKEKVKYMEKYKRLSETDPLTGLLNRRAFQEQVETCLYEEETAILLFMDIDHFKMLNDSYGHAVGDEALKIVSDTLKNSFRSTDIIARFGGDEFIVLVKNMRNDDPINQKIDVFNQKLHKMIEDRSMISDFTISIGVTFVKNKDDFEKIYMDADSAMYRAKKNGGNLDVFYPE
ncbi:MAG: GGDEF domain-containing protein [Acetobacterium sp.]